MGQYYNILIKNRNGTYTAYDRTVKKDGEKCGYVGAKLTEHSWIGNWTMDSLSAKIYKNPLRITWVGDYADQMQEEDITNSSLTIDLVIQLYKHGQNAKTYKSLDYQDFSYDNKILINHDERTFIDMNEYIKNSQVYAEWCLHPLSILTAIGNGYGGGDYDGSDMERVGSWANDLISFDEKAEEDDLIARGYKRISVKFKEGYLEEKRG